MKRCPISYQNCDKSYSEVGLRSLSKKLNRLEVFPYTADEQRKEAFFKSGKFAIPGVHPKLSSILNIEKDGLGRFEITEVSGSYILKPQSENWYELPQNEDVTMKMAEIFGIEVPVHGLIYCKGGSFTYFIKRFDRAAKNNKIQVEDFGVLAGKPKDGKYDFTMEGIAEVIGTHCTFPAVEKYKLLKMTIFNFLVGNEDMHLKNFSLIRRDDKVELSPGYDLVNSTIAAGNNLEQEVALPLNGKRSRLNKTDLLEYFPYSVLKLSEKSVIQLNKEVKEVYPEWRNLISISFLSEIMKQRYLILLETRYKKLFT